MPNESGIQIQRSTDNATWGDLATLPADSPSPYTDTTVLPNTKYYYRHRYLGDNIGNIDSDWSYASVKTDFEGDWLVEQIGTVPASVSHLGRIDRVTGEFFLLDNTNSKIHKLDLSTVTLDAGFTSFSNMGSVNVIDNMIFVGQGSPGSALRVYAKDGTLLQSIGSVFNGWTEKIGTKYYVLSANAELEIWNDDFTFVQSLTLNGTNYAGGKRTDTTGTGFFYSVNVTGGVTFRRVETTTLTIADTTYGSTSGGGSGPVPGDLFALFTSNSHLIAGGRTASFVNIYDTNSMLVKSLFDPAVERVTAIDHYQGAIYAVSRMGKVYRVRTKLNIGIGNYVDLMP